MDRFRHRALEAPRGCVTGNQRGPQRRGCTYRFLMHEVPTSQTELLRHPIEPVLQFPPPEWFQLSSQLLSPPPTIPVDACRIVLVAQFVRPAKTPDVRKHSGRRTRSRSPVSQALLSPLSWLHVPGSRPKPVDVVVISMRLRRPEKDGLRRQKPCHDASYPLVYI